MTTTPALLAAEQIRLNLVDLISSGANPSAGGGVAAAIGSFYLRTTGPGQAWLKTGGGDTNWTQLAQSFAWYSIADYGAVGDGTTDATAAIQQAINDCATAGGGVVFVPAGVYAVTQLTINAQNDVQLLGTGPASVLLWKFNAASSPGALLTITGGSSHTRISQLRFSGASLTNPVATDHLILISGAGGAVVETQIFGCTIGAMVTGAGDGVHVVGTAGNLVSRLWIVDCQFDTCTVAGIGCEQGWEYGWIESNYLTNCATEISFVATADLNSNAIAIFGNEIVHTSATERRALRLEGGATTFITRAIVDHNIVLGGFATIAALEYGVVTGNILTSGAFASAIAAVAISGLVQFLTLTNNLIDRAAGASVGACLSIEAAGGSSPTRIRVGGNMLLNEGAGGGFIIVIDATVWSIGGNQCISTNAGTSTMYGVDVQAQTVAITDAIVGPGNMFSAAAGSMAACVHALAGGANIANLSIVGNTGDQCDYGLAAESSGGAFSGQLLYGGNNINGAVGDIDQIGVTIRPKIGFNASTLGQTLTSGTGAPEGVVTARVGSLYLRTDAVANGAVYYKESGTGNTGWIALAATPLVFGAGDTTAVATAVFLAPGWTAVALTAEIQVNLTRPATIRNLRVNVGVAGTGAATNTYTVRKNGADTVLTTTIANTSAGAAVDTTHSFTTVAGDLLSIDCVKSAPVAAGQTNVTAALELA